MVLPLKEYSSIFKLDADKYMLSLPIYKLIQDIVNNAEIPIGAKYDTFIQDTFQTASSIIDMLRPTMDINTRVILINKAFRLKGNVNSVIDFMKSLGVKVEVSIDYDDEDWSITSRISSDIDLGSLDVPDPQLFINTYERFLYEMLFYGDANSKITRIRFQYYIQSVLDQGHAVREFNHLELYGYEIETSEPAM